MRDVLAYEAVLRGRGGAQLEEADKRELTGRLKDKQASLTTSLVTAYRWAFHPGDNELEPTGLPVPATKDQTVVGRVVRRLSDQDYGNPKILRQMGSVYFLSKVAPALWKDQSAPLEIGEASRRSPSGRICPSSRRERIHSNAVFGRV